MRGVQSEVREHLKATRRLVFLALRPWPEWQHMSDTMIAFAGVVAPTVVGLVVKHLLLGVVVSLSVAVFLLLIAGTRVERQLRGDWGIQLEPQVQGFWIEVGVKNDSSKAADFEGTVEAIEPPPDPRYRPSWIIPWATSAGTSQTIDQGSTRYLRLGQGELTRRASDGELAGSVVFDTVGSGSVPFNYENTAECDDREPINITVQISRLDPRTSIVRKYKVSLEYDDKADRAYPKIECIGLPANFAA
jgi:hypothetical protein